MPKFIEFSGSVMTTANISWLGTKALFTKPDVPKLQNEQTNKQTKQRVGARVKEKKTSKHGTEENLGCDDHCTTINMIKCSEL